MEDILQQVRESATTSSPPFTRGAGGDHTLNHKLHFPNYRVHTKLSDYVSRFRSPSIPLAKGEEEKEFNSLIMEDILQKIRESATTSSPPFTRGAGGDHLLNHKPHSQNHRVHTKLPDYVSKFRSPSIPLAKGEEEKEFNSPPFTRGAGGDHTLNDKLNFPNHRVQIKFPAYVSKFRSPSIPLAKGEEEQEFNAPPFTRGTGGINDT
ncbi:MAG: hypothetical protein NW214_04880 [Pseudanabaenaceae cyanobacterium bins.39]|nr:hypothetical protein [Pseudanabaenaceae cyanobacterium bins.39]